jgi:hypothetical protein
MNGLNSALFSACNLNGKKSEQNNNTGKAFDKSSISDLGRIIPEIYNAYAYLKKHINRDYALEK